MRDHLASAIWQGSLNYYLISYTNKTGHPKVTLYLVANARRLQSVTFVSDAMKCSHCGRMPLQRAAKCYSFGMMPSRSESWLRSAFSLATPKREYLTKPIFCRLHSLHSSSRRLPTPSAVDYRIAAPPVKYDDSGTSEEVRSHLTKIGIPTHTKLSLYCSSVPQLRDLCM